MPQLSIKQIKKFKIYTSDVLIGTLHDLFFIPLDWKIHYLSCDTGFWMLNKTVILSVAAIESIDTESMTIQLKLTKENLENIPIISPENIVTRKHEEELSDHFGWPRYWELKKRNSKNLTNNETSTNSLNFTRDIIGQNVESTDGFVGVISELIIDMSTWEILYVIIINKQISKKGMITLLTPNQIKTYSKRQSIVEIFPNKKEIENAPHVKNINELSKDFENRIEEYY